MKNLEDLKIPVCKGKGKKIQSFKKFITTKTNLAINANKRQKVDKYIIKILYFLLGMGISFRLNQSCIQCFLANYNIFDIQKINEKIIQITIKTCHPWQLPEIKFAIEGSPFFGKTSKTSRINIILPTTDLEFKVLMENFSNFIYRIPVKYSRR